MLCCKIFHQLEIALWECNLYKNGQEVWDSRYFFTVRCSLYVWRVHFFSPSLTGWKTACGPWQRGLGSPESAPGRVWRPPPCDQPALQGRRAEGMERSSATRPTHLCPTERSAHIKYHPQNSPVQFHTILHSLMSWVTMLPAALNHTQPSSAATTRHIWMRASRESRVTLKSQRFQSHASFTQRHTVTK